MRELLVSLGVLFMPAGCVASEGPSPDAGTEGPPSVATPQALEHAAGRWITQLSLAPRELAARCPHCSFTITHDISEIYAAYVIDTTTVYVAQSAVDGIADGSVLCTADWFYAASTNQPEDEVGQLIDYELLADTCDGGSTGIVLEDHALWTLRGPDLMEVFEQPSAAHRSGLTAWRRCTPDSEPSAFCDAASFPAARTK